MKRILASLLGAVLTILFSMSVAGAENDDSKLSADLNIGWFSKYVGGTTGGNFFDHSVLQQSLKVTAEKESTKLSLQIWNSYSPKGGTNSDFGDEFNYIARISKVFNDIEVDVGYAFYNCYDLSNTKGDLHALSIRFDLPKIHGIAPYALLEWDIPVDEEILDGGVVYKFGGMYDLVLPNSIGSQIININLALTGHDGAYGTSPELISCGKLSLSTTFHVWKVGITPEVNFQKRLGYKVRDGGMTSDEIWYGVNFDVPFNLF